MEKVFVCSPYRGNHKALGFSWLDQIQRENSIKFHIATAEQISRLLTLNGKMPLTPHLYFTRFLKDESLAERELGLRLATNWIDECDRVLVYTGCCGISKGMKKEIDYAFALSLPITHIETLWEVK